MGLYQSGANADFPEIHVNLGIPFNTQASLEAAYIPPDITTVETRGHTKIGLGAAIYVVAPIPGAGPGKVQSADGRWWQLSLQQSLCPTMFGSIADGRPENAVADLKGLNDLGQYIRTAPFGDPDVGKFDQRKVGVCFTGGLAFWINDTINWTLIQVGSLAMECSGAQFHLHCTGKVGIDLMGCRGFVCSNLYIRGDEQDPPRIGLQHGRYNQFGQSTNVFTQISFDGKFTRACLINLASESTRYTHCTFQNYDTTPGTLTSGSYCWIMDSWNNENIQSEFVTVVNPVRVPLSMQDVQFDNFSAVKFYNVATQLGRGSTGLITGPSLGVFGGGTGIRNCWIKGYNATFGSGSCIDVDGDLNHFRFDTHNETAVPAFGGGKPKWGTGPEYAMRCITPGDCEWVGFYGQDNDQSGWVAYIGKEPPGALYINMSEIQLEGTQHNRPVFGEPVQVLADPATGVDVNWYNGPIHYQGRLNLGYGDYGLDYRLRDLRQLASFNGEIYTQAPANTVAMPTNGVGGAVIYGVRLPSSTAPGTVRRWGGAAIRGTAFNFLANEGFVNASLGEGPFTVNGLTVDDWVLQNGTGAENSIRRVPGNIGTTYAIEWIRTVTGTTPSFFLQMIPDLRHFAGHKCVCSFDCEFTAGGSVQIGVSIVQMFGTGGSPSAFVTLATQNLTIDNTVRRSEMQFDIPSIVGKVFGTNNDDSLWVRFQRTQLQEDGICLLQNVKFEIGERATAWGETDYIQDAPPQTMYLRGEARVSAALGSLGLAAKSCAFASVYGAGSVTDFGLHPNQVMRVRAESAFTIVASANLIVPGGANIAVLTGDSWWIRADQYGVERLFSYDRNVAP